MLRRATVFGLVANFDQPLAQFNYLNITYPLLVFEYERLVSIFIFDHVQDYLQSNPNYGHALFTHDMTQDVRSSHNIHNF